MKKVIDYGTLLGTLITFSYVPLYAVTIFLDGPLYEK